MKIASQNYPLIEDCPPDGASYFACHLDAKSFWVMGGAYRRDADVHANIEKALAIIEEIENS